MAGSCSGFPLTESYDSHVWLLFKRLLQPLLLLVLFLFIQLFDRGNFEDGHDVWTERLDRTDRFKTRRIEAVLVCPSTGCCGEERIETKLAGSQDRTSSYFLFFCACALSSCSAVAAPSNQRRGAVAAVERHVKNGHVKVFLKNRFIQN